MNVRIHMAAVAVCMVGLAIAGCGGPPKVVIKGKLTKNGQPFTANEKTQVTLSFAPDKGGDNPPLAARFNRADGSFDVEVPPGNYRAYLAIFDHATKTPTAIPPKVRETVHDFTSSKSITIELDK